MSLKTDELNKKQVFQICRLKNTFWKYKISEQLNWFKNNIKPYDIHNILFIKKKIIGYTCLRKRKLFSNKKKKIYLLFDTLIIDRAYQKNKLSSMLMNFNNFIIQQNNYLSILVCKKKLIKFYKKYKWKKLFKSKLDFVDYKNNPYSVLKFNDSNKLYNQKIKIYINS